MIKETVRKQDQQEALRREEEVQQEVAQLKQACMHDASAWIPSFTFFTLFLSLLLFFDAFLYGMTQAIALSKDELPKQSPPYPVRLPKLWLHSMLSGVVQIRASNIDQPTEEGEAELGGSG